MLFDFDNDPNELVDLGNDPKYASERERLQDAIFDWTRRQNQRTTVPPSGILNASQKRALDKGVLIGFWDEAELEEAKSWLE